MQIYLANHQKTGSQIASRATVRRPLQRCGTKSEPQIVMKRALDVTPEQARDARAGAWAFVFRCWQEKQMTTEPAAEPDDPNDVSITNRKEVSDVDHRLDRPSEIT